MFIVGHVVYSILLYTPPIADCIYLASPFLAQTAPSQRAGGFLLCLAASQAPQQFRSDSALIVSQLNQLAVFRGKCLYAKYMLRQRFSSERLSPFGMVCQTSVGSLESDSVGRRPSSRKRSRRGPPGNRQQPYQQRTSFCEVRAGAAPEFEEGILCGLFGQHWVTQDA